MTIEELIKKRKELGINRKLMAKLMGYSYVWLVQVEWKGERRVSDNFLKKYEEVLKKFECLEKK